MKGDVGGFQLCIAEDGVSCGYTSTDANVTYLIAYSLHNPTYQIEQNSFGGLFRHRDSKA